MQLWSNKTDSGAFICDAQTGDILQIFGSCAQWFNCEPDALPYIIAQLTSVDNVGPGWESVRSALSAAASGEPRDWRIRDKFGFTRSIHVDISFMDDEQGEKLAVIVQDRTARNNLLSYYRRSTEFENIGKLGNSMAHDFNNCMQAIMGHAHIVSMQEMGEAEQEESLDEIRLAAEKAGQLAQHLMVFRRLKNISETVFDLSQLVQEIVPVVQQAMGSGIEMSIEKSDEDCSIKADYGQIEQVLMNLIFNAKDSLAEDEGRIGVRTEVVTLDEQWTKTYPWIVPGRYVSLVVKDSGVGMTEEVLKKAFEPFFTTREPVPGKGLGLTTVDAIVKRHLGVVDIKSRPGFGTKATVFLKKVEN